MFMYTVRPRNINHSYEATSEFDPTMKIVKNFDECVIMFNEFKVSSLVDSIV